jgi:hypothetical protein
LSDNATRPRGGRATVAGGALRLGAPAAARRALRFDAAFDALTPDVALGEPDTLSQAGGFCRRSAMVASSIPERLCEWPFGSSFFGVR